MTSLIVLNESTLFGVLWNMVRRRPVHVLTVAPWVPFLRGPFRRLADAVSRRLPDPADKALTEALANFDDIAIRWSWTNVFAHSEPWIEARHGFADIDAEAFEYGLPFKDVTINHHTWYFSVFRAAIELMEQFPDRQFEVVGIDDEAVDFFTACHGMAAAPGFRPSRPPKALINALLSFATTAVACGRIGRWLSLRPPPPIDVHLGVDAIRDVRLYTMLEDVVDDPDQVLCVFRNDEEYSRDHAWFAPFPTCLPFDGVLAPAQAIAAIGHVLATGWALWRRFRHLSPRHFFSLAKFPLVEVTYWALMQKYRFAYFFGRDDYNVEHIFRTWELRRRGGVSLGINHGAPYNPPLFPIYRYIDFDIYYAFGEDIYRNYYAEKWPSTVAIKAVGAFGMRRVMIESLNASRPPDIVVFVKPLIDGIDIIDSAIDVANAFPDRTIYMKIKKNDVRFFDDEARRRYVDERPDNLVFTEERAYDLMCKATYAISTPSTVVFEAIQFGLVSLCFDNFSPDLPFHFREYPDLCHRRIEDIIDRIQGVESGTWRYPCEAYAGLVDLSGSNIFDVIRGDIGLPPMAAERVVRTPTKEKGITV
jgi:hypothetical protein